MGAFEIINLGEASQKEFAIEGGMVVVREYDPTVGIPMNDADVNIIPDDISGTAYYPSEEGYTYNEVSDALITVVEGEGFVVTEAEAEDGELSVAMYVLFEDSRVFLGKGVPYRFIAERGILRLRYTATPAWTPEQSKQA